MKLLTWSALLCSPHGETVTVIRTSWFMVTCQLRGGGLQMAVTCMGHRPLSFFLVVSVPKRGPVTPLSLMGMFGETTAYQNQIYLRCLDTESKRKSFLKISFLEQPSFSTCRVFVAFIIVGKDFDY